MATKTGRKPATKRRVTRTQEKAPEVELTEDQKQAKLQAYAAMKGAGLAIPRELKIVEEWVQELQQEREAERHHYVAQVEAQQQRIAEENINGPWYVRNMTNGPFNLRLERQTEKRRIELKHRGAPGDMHPIKDEDLQDPVLRRNASLGVVEIIPAGEAALIIEKQTTNMGQRTHAPVSVLRNSFGDPMGGVKVETEFNQQGVTVAVPDPDVLTGQRSAKGTQFGGLNRVGPDGQAIQQAEGPRQVQRQSEVRSGFVPTGGNPAIISYGPTGVNAQQDAIARQKNLQGPQAGLGGDFQVTVEPTQRT